jgi:hypothetical protein
MRNRTIGLLGNASPQEEEAPVPSLRNPRPERRGIDWPAFARILSIQLLVLLALSGAFVRYVNWSSDAAFSEFLAASKSPPPAAQPHPQSVMRVSAIRAACFASDRARRTAEPAAFTAAIGAVAATKISAHSGAPSPGVNPPM